MFGFIFFITFSLIGAQTITIVDAQTNTPIQNVNVFVDSVGITSDNYGSCSLDILLYAPLSLKENTGCRSSLFK